MIDNQEKSRIPIALLLMVLAACILCFAVGARTGFVVCHNDAVKYVNEQCFSYDSKTPYDGAFNITFDNLEEVKNAGHD